jgi:serine/threonine-protein kinase
VSDAATRLSTALADHYRVERELGAGGMATVYLAEDLKHHRRVAIKVLRPELAAVIGADRFLREIETIAGLQHPHILGLIDSGEVAGTAYYVMPFVEGESLRDRLGREKQLPIGDAVRIATEVASALDYAHRHGVIHRDVKPENILLHDGAALVADFGIALAASKAGGERMTETGMSLGTPQYMSPEQAMGEREITARSDIYALGATTYEMLAGAPPFTGPTAQAIVAKIVASQPEPLSALRKTVPPHVEDAVLTALEKIPADRFASASAFARALEWTGSAVATHSGRTRSAARAVSGRRRFAWPLAAAVLALVALAGWARPWRSESNASSNPPTQLALLLPDIGGSSTGLQRQLELTPDGSSLMYVANVDGLPRTKLIALDGSGARVLDGVGESLADYSISPDGRMFTAADFLTGGIFRYPIGGGPGRPLPREVATGNRGVWAGDGSFWIGNRAGGQTTIVRLSATDSVSRPFGRRVTDVFLEQILPGDRYALAVRTPPGASTGPVVLLDLRSGDESLLLDEPVVEARYAVGHLVWVLGDGSLQAAPFELGTRRITAPPVTLATGVTVTGGGQAQFSVASNGTVAYLVEAGRSLVVADRAGNGRAVLAELRTYHHPRFSPDGRRISVDLSGPEGRDVWIMNLADSTLTRATFDRDGHDASWSRDGRSLFYLSVRGGVLGVHRIRTGSTQSGDSLLTSAQLGYSGIPLRDDAALLTVGRLLPESNLDIVIIRNGGRGPIEPIVATKFDERYPALSRDDQWLAFTSNQSGRDEVYLRSLAGDGEQIQVSVAGGTEVVWSPDGRELIYRSSTNAEGRVEPTMMAATISTNPTLAVVSRKALFPAAGIVTATPHANYDVSPDGKRFLIVRSNPSTRVMVMQNLAAMVARRRVGGRGGQ